MSTSGLIALREASFPAMGTEVSVVVPSATPAGATDRVRLLFARWEQVLSRFDCDSELSRLNDAAGSPFRASPLLFRVLQAALRAARATDGLFDPALGGQLVAAGYDRDFPQVRRRPGPQGHATCGGAWRRILMNPETRVVTIPADCAIDLGGIAKGMAVDAAIAGLRDCAVTSALVSAGGDLRVIGRPPAHPRWGIALDEVGGRVIALSTGAMATSSTSGRAWRAGDGTSHHLIDPDTGRPSASGTRAVTVAARTCAQAEVAAKAALLAGPLEGADLLRRLGLPAIVVPHHGDPVTIGEWPEGRPWT